VFAVQDAFAPIEASMSALLEQEKRPLSLGGDHSMFRSGCARMATGIGVELCCHEIRKFVGLF
jgi:hypothetical protein